MAATERPATTHRERLLAGMAASVRERGFRATTLADVVRHAGVSRRTFYEHFSDPVDCYLALVEQVGEHLLSAIAGALEGTDGSVPERLDAAVGAYLDFFTRDPDLSRSYWTEAEVTGERGRALTARLSFRTGELLAALADVLRESEPDLLPISPEAGTMMAAGIREAVLLAHDDGRPLDAVRPTAVQMLSRALGLRV